MIDVFNIDKIKQTTLSKLTRERKQHFNKHNVMNLNLMKGHIARATALFFVFTKKEIITEGIDKILFYGYSLCCYFYSRSSKRRQSLTQLDINIPIPLNRQAKASQFNLVVSCQF